MRPPANHGDNRQTNISIHAPARGATPGLSVDHVGHQISIHAPARGATYRSTVTEETPTISIHAPARGATAVRVVLHASVVISIHAPARGATGGKAAWAIFPCDFNPRTREGCDGHQSASSSTAIEFQSTHPRGVRQPMVWIFVGVFIISIHAPARGATANTANRLPVFTPLLQHILQDFTSIRHIQNAETAKKSKNQVRNSWQFHVRSRFAPVLK